MIVILRSKVGLLPSGNSPVGEQRARGVYLSVIRSPTQGLWPAGNFESRFRAVEPAGAATRSIPTQADTVSCQQLAHLRIGQIPLFSLFADNGETPHLTQVSLPKTNLYSTREGEACVAVFMVGCPGTAEKTDWRAHCIEALPMWLYTPLQSARQAPGQLHGPQSAQKSAGMAQALLVVMPIMLR